MPIGESYICEINFDLTAHLSKMAVFRDAITEKRGKKLSFREYIEQIITFGQMLFFVDKKCEKTWGTGAPLW